MSIYRIVDLELRNHLPIIGSHLFEAREIGSRKNLGVNESRWIYFGFLVIFRIWLPSSSCWWRYGSLALVQVYILKLIIHGLSPVSSSTQLRLTFVFIVYPRTGISGKSQVLFALVYTTRYLDLFTNYISLYNSFMKVSDIIPLGCTWYQVSIPGVSFMICFFRLCSLDRHMQLFFWSTWNSKLPMIEVMTHFASNSSWLLSPSSRSLSIMSSLHWRWVLAISHCN